MHNHPERIEEVLPAWNRCHGAFYQLSESDLLWNQSEQRLLRYWRSEVEGVPVLWAETAPEGAELGILPKGIWLSLYGEIVESKAAGFVAAVERLAREAGKTRLAIGSDEFHFMPGIPVDEMGGANLSKAFLSVGFSSYDCADLVGSPDNEAAKKYSLEAALQSRERGWSLKEAISDGDKDKLSTFLEREFSGRWFREWKVWCKRSDMGRAYWNLLRDEKGQVIGFSRLARRGRIVSSASAWTPGALRSPLSPGALRLDTDSCLGPIGVAAAERGRGAGKVLLGLSLENLVLQGAKLTCIDWTNAYNYYTPLGFNVARRYLSMWKDL